MTTSTRERQTETPFVPAKADKSDQVKPDAPKSANEVLARVDEDHNWSHDPIDMNTTGGVQKAIERNWKAIQALANYVDGKPIKTAA